MSLTQNQIEIIKKFVSENKITLPTLKDDIVDHLCCEVEACMADGKKFEESLRQAVYDLAPHGLNFIQQRTFFLLDGKIIINMRKLTFVIGSLSAMSMSFGWMLKLLAFPGVGNPFFGLGAAAFLLLFLPLLAINYFRRNTKPMTHKLKMMFGVMSVFFIGIAFLARIMHLPGADEVLWVGGLIFIFGFLQHCFTNSIKNRFPSLNDLKCKINS